MKELTENTEVKLKSAQIEVLNSDRRTFTALLKLLESTQREFDSLWNNPKASAEKQLEIRGKKAKNGFYIHSLAVNLCMEAGIEYDYSKLIPPVEYVINEDGSVTITK
jgi:hypothetical protein